jgi:antitoxin component YwqK of YwqJK toxin-antitoxin module
MGAALGASGSFLLPLLVSGIMVGCISIGQSRWVFVADGGDPSSGTFDGMSDVEEAGKSAVHGRTGRLTTWDKCGTRTETTFRNGRREGEQTRWSSTGVLVSQGQWTNDQAEGKWKSFWPNGVRQSILHYHEGELHGVCTHWSEQEQKVEESEYLYGRTVWRTTWYTNGVIRSQETMRGGDLHGRSRYWTSDGRLVANGEYREGRRWDGTFLAYGPDGHEWTGIMTFNAGKLVSTGALSDLGAERAKDANFTNQKPPEGLAVPSSAPQSAVIEYAGGDGRSIEGAVIVRNVQNEANGVRAEAKWIRKHYPGWTQSIQALVIERGRNYDQIEYTSPEDERVTIFFDITDFFGKQGVRPHVSTNDK